VIRLSNVTKLYQTETIETLALDNLTLEVGSGEFVAIMGPSGCGKTTLMNLIGLLDRPNFGDLHVAGAPVANLPDRDLSRLRNQTIGFVFQSFNLVADLTVLDNVELPLLYRGLPRAERRRRALDAIERVGLSFRAQHYPSQLSGGQQQRVAVARALVGVPKQMRPDAPTGNLDSKMGDEIMGLLEQAHKDGATVVMVTHDDRLAERADRIVRLFDGRQVA
jgi:putative ABC transport system ATP-binding protein